MQPASERPLPYFQRAALLVENMERALEVYRDLLGFQLEFIGDSESDAYAYEVFAIPTDVEIHFAALSSDSQQRTLALISAPGHAASLGSARRTAVVVQVASVAATLAAAAERGLATCAARTYPAPPKGPPRTEAAFYDHDGHTVVIYQLE